MNKFKKITSISQCLILVIGIFAFAWMIGGEVGFVSGKNKDPSAITTPAVGTQIFTGFKEGYIFETVTERNWAYKGDDLEGVISNLNTFYGEGVFKKEGLETIKQTTKINLWKNPRGELVTNPNDLNKLTKRGTEASKPWYENIYTIESASWMDILGSSAAWGVSAYFMSTLVLDFMGVDKGTSKAVSAAAGFGLTAGRAAYGFTEYYGTGAGPAGGGKLWGMSGETVGIGAGAGVAVIVFVMMYSEEETETITYTCDVWNAPIGGNNCEVCNEEDLPCSEYQCRSLGQACELLNADDPTEATCEWINRHDTEYPIIQPWEDALTDGYDYNPDNTISPPDRGVKILNSDSDKECVEAFTPLEFGIYLDEPGQCKVDYIRKNTFEEMEFYFGGTSLFRYNHSQIMSLPGESALKSENITIQNNGNYELYVRCQDANGNYNTANFVFKYCVDEGPDTTPPLIVATNILNGQPVAFNQSSVDLELYINEPSACKWSRLDKSYEEMENQMSCSTSVTEMNARMLYECSTTLDGIANAEDNIYYIKCEDQQSVPVNDRNRNQESYEFVLKGSSDKLAITEVNPNETVKGATDPVKVNLEVETLAGCFGNGTSTCYYSSTNNEEDYIEFYNTNSYLHSQELYLAEGDYEYFIKCVDLGGNTAYNSTEFSVDSDREAPLVVRAYHEDTYLKLVTDEEDAECVYDTSGCDYDFDDGVSMTSLNEGRDHYTDWTTDDDFYIKCKDEYGNEPAPNECSIIIRPSEL